MGDLFKQADMRQVLHGDAGGMAEWSIAADQLKFTTVRDEVGHQYAVVRGTEFVIELCTQSDGAGAVLWRGGLLGDFIGSYGSLSDALLAAKRLSPPQLIQQLYHVAGRNSGRRQAV